MAAIATLLFGFSAGADPCDTDPSVTLAASAPDASGIVTFTLGYSFPNTSPTQRSIEVRRGTSTIYSAQPVSASGSLAFTQDTTCWKQGAYEHVATATSCGTRTASVTAVATVGPSQARISLTHTGPDAQGVVTFNGTYEFPNTDHYSQRTVEVIRGDRIVFSMSPENMTGSFSFVQDTTCWVGGDYVHVASAFSCTGDNAQTQDVVTVGASQASIDLASTGPDEAGVVTFTITYDFPIPNRIRHR